MSTIQSANTVVEEGCIPRIVEDTGRNRGKGGREAHVLQVKLQQGVQDFVKVSNKLINIL